MKYIIGTITDTTLWRAHQWPFSPFQVNFAGSFNAVGEAFLVGGGSTNKK